MANRRFLELRDMPEWLGRPGTRFEDQVRFRAERGDYGPGDPQAFVDAHVALARRFEPHCVERTRADGTVLEIRGNPLPGGGFIAAYTDITELKRVEQALRDKEGDLESRLSQLEAAKSQYEEQASELAASAEALHMQKERAEAADRAKFEFLAAASHELRTPLNAIIGFSQVIRSSSPGELGAGATAEYVGHIHESGMYLLDLINDILDFSKIESGRDELVEEETDIADLLASVSLLVLERATAQDVTLDIEADAALPKLYADPRKIKPVLVNLLSNAIKFTPEGGTVMLKAWAGQGGFVFQVVDSGIGIAMEDVPKALAVFGQIDSELARTHKGTGLGLPLSKTLVERHSGSLDLQSEVGVGTTVTVRLPVDRILAHLRPVTNDAA